MVIKLAFLFSSLLPFLVHSQISKDGIKFEEGLRWMQIVEKAKAENKYIFWIATLHGVRLVKQWKGISIPIKKWANFSIVVSSPLRFKWTKQIVTMI